MHAFAASALLLQCPSLNCTPAFYSITPERIAFNDRNSRDLTAESLGLREGETTMERAVEAMRERGLTNIETNSYYESGRSFGLLIADYQTAVHVFRNGRYSRTVGLGIGPGLLPHRYAIRAAYREGADIAVVLVRDAAGIEEPRLSLVSFPPGEAPAVDTKSLARLSRRHGGMQYPLFVGYDIGAGITFIARDAGGTPWENGYIVSYDGSTLRVRPVPFMELMQCSCVHDWARGQDGE